MKMVDDEDEPSGIFIGSFNVQSWVALRPTTSPVDSRGGHLLQLVIDISGGETIKNIKEQSRAHVELQRNPPPNTDPNVRIFSIRGTAQQLEKARQLIDERIGVGGLSPALTAPPPFPLSQLLLSDLIFMSTHVIAWVSWASVFLVASRMSPEVKHEESIKWT